MTPEERESIINETIERALLLLPETCCNLINTHLSHVKQNRDFYAKHPEFKDNKDSVASVIEMIEGQGDGLLDYDEILRRAVPKIRKRIQTLKGLDMQTVTDKPSRDFKAMDIPQAKRPNPHGNI